MFEIIKGMPNIPSSNGLRFSENFPNMEENNAGKIIDTAHNKMKNIVVIPTTLEIFDTI